MYYILFPYSSNRIWSAIIGKPRLKAKMPGDEAKLQTLPLVLRACGRQNPSLLVEQTYQMSCDEARSRSGGTAYESGAPCNEEGATNLAGDEVFEEQVEANGRVLLFYVMLWIHVLLEVPLQVSQ
ncbi:hypothetical protein GOP47_0006362, partial [Adiantum capillus-veneris]